VIAVDTNAVVRLVTNDDPVQSPRAAALFAASDVFISKTVVLETEWVLRYAYQLDVAAIAGVLERLLAASSVTVESAPQVRRAVAWFAAGMDFADSLHLASCEERVERFATFDRKLAKRAARTEGVTKVVVV